MDRAISILEAAPPDVMNHNLETVPRLYKAARPGSDYEHSLRLLETFKDKVPNVPTKSGIMLGLGETLEEVLAVMQDLRRHRVDMLTVGQYLAPSQAHYPVQRYALPSEFEVIESQAKAMGFVHAAVGPLVRSSYHADQQSQGVLQAR
jgi:Lipoate synthase